MNLVTTNQNDAAELKGQTARKRVSSILDPFTEQLLRMDDENKTLNEMTAWLKPQGIETSANNVSKFLISRRRRRELAEQMNAEKDAFEAFQEWKIENPDAPLEVITERFNLLALSLSVQKEAAPEVLKLADRLVGTASRVANDRSREDYRTRKLVMEEAKHAEWVKVEQTRALELCLTESKKYPAVADMYRAAFAALEKCQKEDGA